MVQNERSNIVPLSDAYKDLLQIVKGAASKEMKEKVFHIQAEVSYIHNKIYGGNQYIKAYGDNENPLQLIVPVDIAKTLQTKNYYKFSGSFETSNSPDYGLFQFRVSSAIWLGKDMRLEAKKQAANEIIELGYLDKYKDDFAALRGKSHCHVALVTSPQSQVIRDVIEVFKARKGIKHEIVPVKLSDANGIAQGITDASVGKYDVIMIIRGGGNESDFVVFNDPSVVKAIHDSRIPVIVGIGHTDNNTFADKAADRSETTPSKAARFLVDMLGQSVQSTQQTASFNKQTYRRPYEAVNKRTREFRKSNSGSIAVKLGLTILFIAVAGAIFFTVLPKVFENILKGM
ncbi:exodeoxyribonuclease VII large subunit [Paenibacillus puerhi]|uniref:exodeoxyribonuclease VII large subunit n=1 Tax=Paenibacillus puerhi TaxID=2692622 RepID=UPI00135C8F6B|nr:exodeoxyribonuclease VII large subunit [Paenibacillus puerhi]